MQGYRWLCEMFSTRYATPYVLLSGALVGMNVPVGSKEGVLTTQCLPASYVGLDEVTVFM